MSGHVAVANAAENANIFRNGSRTFFYSSLFFPAHVRSDVSKLYGFMRVADDLVDSVPQRPERFAEFRADYAMARRGRKVENEIVQAYVEMANRHQFDGGWTDAFLEAMASDLGEVRYQSIGDLRWYIYGAAEVVGLMSQRLLGLPEEAQPASQLLGRAFQYINFIRDIQEDLDMNRQYLPIEDLETAGLTDLSESSARANPDAFRTFMEHQFERYRKWQKDAEQGLSWLPTRLRIPVKTAADMYWWTAEQIQDDPWLVFQKKVKPSIPRIILAASANASSLGFGDITERSEVRPAIRRSRRA
jgi:phytoene synthase